jgi:hypothetical protein
MSVILALAKLRQEEWEVELSLVYIARLGLKKTFYTIKFTHLKYTSHLAWWYTSIIPVTQEVEIRRVMVQGQPRRKVTKTLPATSKLGMVVHACDPSYAGGVDLGTRWAMSKE